MVTGRAAFAGESVTVILLNIVSREPAPATLVAPELPPELDYVLARCLAKDPEARYPDARSLALDLEDILAGRAARGRRDWKPTAASGTLVGPAPRAAGAIDSGGDPAPSIAAAPPTVASEKASAPRRPGARTAPPRRAWRASAAATVGLAVVVAGALFALRPEPVARRVTPAPAVPTARPATPTPLEAAPPVLPSQPTPTPASESSEARVPEPVAASDAALLRLDFEHSLKAGTLRVWVDDVQVVEQELDGRVTKEIVGIKLRKGRLAETMEVKPGRRVLSVRVDWDGKSQTENMRINFKPGETYRVRAKLGSLGGIRKNLSLGWY
jgi:serine/threonine-protein kinase